MTLAVFNTSSAEADRGSSLLDKLWLEGLISLNEYEAGKRYRAALVLAAGEGPRNADNVVDARLTVLKIGIGLGKVAPMVLRKILLEETSPERVGVELFRRPAGKDAQAAGFKALRFALSALRMEVEKLKPKAE